MKAWETELLFVYLGIIIMIKMKVMIIVMQTTVDYMATTNPAYLQKLESLGKPERKQLDKIQYYKFGESN